MDAALQVGAAAGIAPAKLLRALEPLVRATVDNVFALGPARAPPPVPSPGGTPRRSSVTRPPSAEPIQELRCALLHAWPVAERAVRRLAKKAERPSGRWILTTCKQ